MMKSKITLAYDLDKWYDFGEKQPILVDVSKGKNYHAILAGQSGAGKSYLVNLVLAKLFKVLDKDSIFYFGDFKQDDQFLYLSNCPRYYPFEKTLIALDEVYQILKDRQTGVNQRKKSVIFIWDEYIANVLYLQNISKKNADEVMRKVSEILMLGRSLNITLICTTQRPDSYGFPLGSRLNFGLIVILGPFIKSIYEMLMPKDYIEIVEKKQFEVGEGVVLLNGYQLKFIKVPKIKNMESVQKLCIEALTR